MSSPFSRLGIGQCRLREQSKEIGRVQSGFEEKWATERALTLMSRSMALENVKEGEDDHDLDIGIEIETLLNLPS